MHIWEKITYPFKTLGGKEIDKELVHEHFMKQDIKACDIEDTVGYLVEKLECTRNCSQCLLFYLEKDLGINNKGNYEKLNTGQNVKFSSVLDEFGEQQLRLW